MLIELRSQIETSVFSRILCYLLLLPVPPNILSYLELADLRLTGQRVGLWTHPLAQEELVEGLLGLSK